MGGNVETAKMETEETGMGEMRMKMSGNVETAKMENEETGMGQIRKDMQKKLLK